MKDNQRKVPEMTPLLLVVYILVIVVIGLFFFFCTRRHVWKNMCMYGMSGNDSIFYICLSQRKKCR